MKTQIQVPCYRYCKLYGATKTMTLSMGLFLIGILALSCLFTSIFNKQNQALAQQYIQTIKYRNLVIDLGNGVKTNAQLTLPAVGKGPFPGVLLIAGTGPTDKNETLGLVLKDKPPPAQPLLQIAKYLSERGFAVLRYDKRGVGGNFTNVDKNVWGNATINDLIHDAAKAMNVLIAQPEVNGTKGISIIGHSEGTIIAPRLAVDNPAKVKNIVLIGAQAQNLRDGVYFQEAYLPMLYAEKVLDHNHNGSISIQEASKDPIFQSLTITQVSPTTVKPLFTGKVIPSIQYLQSINASNNNNSKQNYISIDKGLKPLLLEKIASLTAKNASCTLDGCPIWFKSHFDLGTTLGMIGNVSSSTGILILQGENDTQTPVQQAFLLQQRLTDVNHPDHTLITYPGLGHNLSPAIEVYPGSSMYGIQKSGPIEDYALADLYAWLEAHSGFTRIPVVMPSSNSSSSSSTATK
ncbi:MAG: alpha/beta hydrolase family protein [Nitrososphaera sp.]